MREIFVTEAFASKSVLVTGATGFVGKVLVEKLLRSCRGIDKIFVLVRAKNGQGVKERLERFKNSAVFGELKSRNKALALEKLVPIEGDLTISPQAGISNENLDVIKDSVNFIFHCAALTKANETIETAIRVNLIGTRNILYLAGQINGLEAFVHVSSAFTNLTEAKILEEIYKPFFDYKRVVEWVEQGASAELKEFTAIASKALPNTYLISKNLTEQLVLDRSIIIPSAIVRPSIIGPTYQEPMPGWGENFTGLSGAVIGATSGFVRSIHGSGSSIADLMPCDFAVNAIVASAASVASSDNKELKIYNCIASKPQLQMTWNEFMGMCREVYANNPSTKAVWFPGARFWRNYYVFLLWFGLFQLLPSYLIDLVYVAMRKETWAVKKQKKILKAQKNFSYLLRTSCEWDNANFELLYKLISIQERKLFNFEVATLDYRDYVANWISGAQKFLLKVDDGNSSRAKRTYKVLYFADFLLKNFFYFFIGYKVYVYYFAT